MNKLASITIISLAIITTSTKLFAKEQHGAHEHGKAKLDIAIEGAKIALNFESPAESIYGFEHEAKSPKDLAARESAAKIFKENALDLFKFDPSLGCKVAAANVDPWVKEDHDDDHDHHSAKTPDKSKKSSKTKKDKSTEKGSVHHEDEHGEHGELHARYSIECSKAPTGTKLNVTLMSKFPKLQEIAMQLISDQKQLGATLKSSNAVIEL